MSELLKAYQAAKILGISESTLNKYVRAGIIPCVKINDRNKRYREEDLKNFVKERLYGTFKL